MARLPVAALLSNEAIIVAVERHDATLAENLVEQNWLGLGELILASFLVPVSIQRFCHSAQACRILLAPEAQDPTCWKMHHANTRANHTEVTEVTEVHEPSGSRSRPRAPRRLPGNSSRDAGDHPFRQWHTQRRMAWADNALTCLRPRRPPHQPCARSYLPQVGIRAAEGHVGSVNRWFAGTKYIDEIESLCIELLKQVFHARYADHRLVASMIGNMVVYASMTQPDDTIMTVAQPFGGHSSNRQDGPAGVRGLNIVDIPFDPIELTVDLDRFRRARNDNTPQVGHARPLDDTVSATGACDCMRSSAEWGGDIYFDGAHQLGLIAGGQFQDPLTEGAAVLTGSAGKTFSGPQSGVIVWNNERLTKPLTTAIFRSWRRPIRSIVSPRWPPPPSTCWLLVNATWPRSCGMLRRLARPCNAKGFLCWAATRALHRRIRRLRMCASLVAGWRLRSDWRARISSPTKT